MGPLFAAIVLLNLVWAHAFKHHEREVGNQAFKQGWVARAKLDRTEEKQP